MSAPNHNPEIDRILSSLDGINRAEPSDSFEEQLFTRIESLPTSENSLTSWFKWSVAAMLLMAMVNVYVLVRQQSTIQTETLTELWQTDNMFSSTDLFLESTETSIEP